MQIAVIGNESNVEELKQKFGPSHSYMLNAVKSLITNNIKNAQLVFDFLPDENESIRYDEIDVPIFVNTTYCTLSSLLNRLKVNEHKRDSIFGFCGWPTFVNRNVLEVTAITDNVERLEGICSQLNTEYVCIKDRVGMATPRVIAMIINEAYYTLEEGIAKQEEIDLAMKLGTGYPYGPFEWANRIGLFHVTKLLDVMYEDTGDDRYKVCDLLRNEGNN